MSIKPDVPQFHSGQNQGIPTTQEIPHSQSGQNQGKIRQERHNQGISMPTKPDISQLQSEDKPRKSTSICCKSHHSLSVSVFFELFADDLSCMGSWGKYVSLVFVRSHNHIMENTQHVSRILAIIHGLDTIVICTIGSYVIVSKNQAIALHGFFPIKRKRKKC